MPLYPVNEGHTYTIGDKVYKAGETVELEPGQAAGWLGLVLGDALTAKETRAVAKAEAVAAKEEGKKNVG